MPCASGWRAEGNLDLLAVPAADLVRRPIERAAAPLAAKMYAVGGNSHTGALPVGNHCAQHDPPVSADCARRGRRQFPPAHCRRNTSTPPRRRRAAGRAPVRQSWTRAQSHRRPVARPANHSRASADVIKLMGTVMPVRKSRPSTFKEGLSTCESVD